MSGASVAYHLRVNKYIDRQLFVESLKLIDRFFPLDDYVYVSMAGAYLEDCRVIHNATGISRMLSFDADHRVLARQVVNMPFGFVKLRCRTSESVIRDFESIRGQFGNEEANVILWLDYTSPGERRKQLQELRTLVPKLIAGDVVRVTMNAHRPTLGENSTYTRLKDDDRPPTLGAWRLQKLKDQLGEHMPIEDVADDALEQKEGLYTLLLKAIKLAVVDAIEARCELQVMPILSTAYDDQHGMVTVTFTILRTDEVEAFKSKVHWESWNNDPGVEWDRFVEIQSPTLSIRERQLLHGLIKSGGEFSGHGVRFIEPEDIERYRMHYSRYPSFAPLDIT